MAGQPVSEGALLWTPSADFVANSELARFQRWLAEERGLEFSDYEALWSWSVADLTAFWGSIWAYFEILSATAYESVLDATGVFGARWFPGATTNYAEHLLRHEARARPDEVAFFHSAETRPLRTITWQELGQHVRRVASHLRALGVLPGDRVVSYMPNVPETAIAMMATTAIGAVWSSAAPEFGSQAVVERFGQIKPKVIFVVDGYSFGGKLFDRRTESLDIVSRLPSLEVVVTFEFIHFPFQEFPSVKTLTFQELLKSPGLAREKFEFTRVPSDHPLWILFSSGTTGLPKAIVHTHVGMIVEHLKCMTLHCNLNPSKRMFFYSTTGWMMWNSVISALITGSSAVLYDGSPVHGGPDFLWRMAEASRTTLFGASPTLVQNMEKANVKPNERFDLSAMDCVIVGGAPSTPETFRWFYENVKSDLWVASHSGGTEICSGFVGGVATRPVHAGEIQGRCLGMDVHVWSDDGQETKNMAGELVIASPAPSMPLRFWGDDDNARYVESYFSTFAGVWRHGDLAKINDRGGVYVYGRSDSTLNRFGVRIGSAEIYRIMERVPGVVDSLVICCETPNGGYFMPLFVTLSPGLSLDESLKVKINRQLRIDASPRHVPDQIYDAPAIPYTLTGKKMEVPIRKIIMGMRVEKAASRDAMSNPSVLNWFGEFSNRPDVREKSGR
jgi:acetoacetyl-CoA synthetase